MLLARVFILIVATGTSVLYGQSAVASTRTLPELADAAVRALKGDSGANQALQSLGTLCKGYLKGVARGQEPVGDVEVLSELALVASGLLPGDSARAREYLGTFHQLGHRLRLSPSVRGELLERVWERGVQQYDAARTILVFARAGAFEPLSPNEFERASERADAGSTAATMILWAHLVSWDLRQRGDVDQKRAVINRLKRIALKSLDLATSKIARKALLEHFKATQNLPLIVEDRRDMLAQLSPSAGPEESQDMKEWIEGLIEAGFSFWGYINFQRALVELAIAEMSRDLDRPYATLVLGALARANQLQAEFGTTLTARSLVDDEDYSAHAAPLMTWLTALAGQRQTTELPIPSFAGLR